MTIFAHSVHSTEVDSRRAGREVAEKLLEASAGEGLSGILLYSTVNHGQNEVLQAIRDVAGPGVTLAGCSTGGIMQKGELLEEGFAVGAMGFGGSVATDVVLETEIAADTFTKGRSLGKRLRTLQSSPPRAVILLYDPLCGANIQRFLDGFHQECSCPVLGGAAGQNWGRMIATYQYFNEQVLGGAAVALTLSGPFAVEIGLCHGASPVGLEATVTRADDNGLLELDGRPAMHLMREMTGCDEEVLTSNEAASWPLGLQVEGDIGGPDYPYLTRAVFGFDQERQGVILQASIPEGSTVMFHHRTLEGVLQGTERMTADLRQRLDGRQVQAALGFECVARVTPFLGTVKSREENQQLYEQIGGKAPWLGMLAWGEVAPMGGVPTFHNYTYVVLLLLD